MIVRYMVETPHPEDELACRRFIKQVVELGSHYYSNADWGCHAGVHKSWITIEAGSETEALLAVPPMLRRGSRVVEIFRLTPEDARTFVLDPTLLIEQHPER